jgi:hypothetical protein
MIRNKRFLEPQHGLLRQRTSSVAGNDRRVQPPDNHAKQYTKKLGAHANLLNTTEDWPPTTFAFDITAVTR